MWLVESLNRSGESQGPTKHSLRNNGLEHPSRQHFHAVSLAHPSIRARCLAPPPSLSSSDKSSGQEEAGAPSTSAKSYGFAFSTILQLPFSGAWSYKSAGESPLLGRRKHCCRKVAVNKERGRQGMQEDSHTPMFSHSRKSVNAVWSPSISSPESSIAEVDSGSPTPSTAKCTIQTTARRSHHGAS